ncbi:nuclear transport factor 2 family protein [Micromonospora sp. CA-259024]|uniref:nuclear transport factor 2 family protein n=1 Tax=Micromonospora sp. CA-259024 TaxID=3239965 RepID=UPI003D910C0E
MGNDRQFLPGDDLQGYLTNYPQEVSFGDDPAEVVFDRYHTPDFVLYNDGLPLDREKLLAHVRPARKRASSIYVDVHDTVIQGSRVAARYTLGAVMRKGGNTVVTEIHLFGQLAADGRLQRVDQISRTLPAGDNQSE